MWRKYEVEGIEKTHWKRQVKKKKGYGNKKGWNKTEWKERIEDGIKRWGEWRGGSNKR